MVYLWISSIVDAHVVQKSSYIIFNLIKTTKMNVKRKNLVFYLLNKYKYAIWMCRNIWKFEKKDITSNFIIIFILNRVKLRVKADLIRMSRDMFMSYYSHLKCLCNIMVGDNNLLSCLCRLDQSLWHGQ